MDDSDIVERLRNYNTCSDTDVDEAADEIERLRKEREKARRERDEARRSVCKMEERLGCDESGCPKNGLAQDHAKRRGWDCFKEEA